MAISEKKLESLAQMIVDEVDHDISSEDLKAICKRVKQMTIPFATIVFSDHTTQACKTEKEALDSASVYIKERVPFSIGFRSFDE